MILLARTEEHRALKRRLIHARVMADLCQVAKDLTIEVEYRFHPTRRWRFDYAVPNAMIAVEIEGGAWTRGRHTRGRGYIADLEKYQTARAMGWAVIQVTPDQALNGDALKWLLAFRTHRRIREHAA